MIDPSQFEAYTVWRELRQNECGSLVKSLLHREKLVKSLLLGQKKANSILSADFYHRAATTIFRLTYPLIPICVQTH